MENSSPDTIARQLIQKAHNFDALPEVAAGFFFLLVSALLYVITVLPKGTSGFRTAVLILAFGVPVFCFSARPLLNWVRRRYLIGREGYVQPKRTGRKEIVTGIVLAVLVAAVLFVLVPRLSHPDRWLLAGTGLAGGALAAWSGRLPRFVPEGLWMAAVGISLAIAGVSLQTGFIALFGLQGIVMLLVGTAVFVHFLRQPIGPGE